MKIKHRLSLNSNTDSKFIADLGLKPEIKGILTFYYIDDNDPRLCQIQSKLTKDIADVKYIEYSPDDYTSSNWFWINVSESAYPQPENPADFNKATYNLDEYCSSCGIGKIQNKPFRLKADIPIKSYQFLGLHWVFDAIFTRSEAKNILEQNQITGIHFIHPIYHLSEKPITSLFQIQIDTTLADGYMPESNELVTCVFKNEEAQQNHNLYDVPIKKAGHYCGRVKYHFPRDHQALYKKELFDHAPDFVLSSEWFGSGYAAYKMMIVSKKVYDLVNNNNWKGIKFTPIGLK